MKDLYGNKIGLKEIVSKLFWLPSIFGSLGYFDNQKEILRRDYPGKYLAGIIDTSNPKQCLCFLGDTRNYCLETISNANERAKGRRIFSTIQKLESGLQ